MTMIRVRLAAGSSWKEVEYRDGMRVGDVLKILKYHPASIAHVRVNNFPATEETSLKDGDEVIIVPLVGGG